MWRVNIIHGTFLLKSLSKKLMAREKRCAVLFTSSMAAYVNYSAYSATKISLSNFGESISFELKNNVDVLVWEPGFVHSNLHLGRPPSGTIATDIAVTGVLK